MMNVFVSEDVAGI